VLGTTKTNKAAHERASHRDQSLRRIVQAGSGILICLRGQEGRGIGLANKIRPYALPDAHHDTVSANSALGLPFDARNYGPAVAILLELGVQRVRLLTNKRYLQAKAEKLGHLLAQNIEH
jgi:GTP cyclohydrolase II